MNFDYRNATLFLLMQHDPSQTKLVLAVPKCRSCGLAFWMLHLNVDS